MTEYYLAEVVPAVTKVKIPVTRDQAMLLLIAVNEMLLGLDTYLAHQTNGTITPHEWIPILFGPIAGAFLLFAGLIALRSRMTANIIGTLVFLTSIIIGVLGSYYHWSMTLLMNAPSGQQVQVSFFIWAPPLLGPLTFALFGILGLSAAWQESPADSGRLQLPAGLRLQMPLKKTRAYFLLIGLGIFITLLSAVIDHAYSSFSNPWTWIPIVVGLFATVVTILLGFFDHPTRSDLVTYAAAIGLMIITGMTGFFLHILQDLTSQGGVVVERFIRNAPLMAPLLFANMALFMLLILLEPGDR